MLSFTIQTAKGPRTIGNGQPTFIIAEMSANHMQNYATAVEIVRAAAKAGVDAIKLQTYTPDSMTIDCDKEWFKVGGGGNPDSWSTETLYSIYQKSSTPLEWHAPLKQLAEKLGLVFFSSAFDGPAVDFLESLNVSLYKIASYEVTHIPLLKKIANTRKPVIISTGFASQEEVELAIQTLRQHGTKDICVLHCVTAYSSNPNIEEINLKTMIDIRDRYNVICGFSDNNAGMEIPLQAVNMGASVIEKHVVVSSKEKTLDANFSLDSKSLKKFVDSVRRAEKISGKVNYGIQGKAEEHNLRYRRSIFITENVKKGELLTAKNIRVIRPGLGLAPKYYEEILGKKAKEDIERGIPLQWNLINEV